MKAEAVILYERTYRDGSVVRLSQWPEGLVLWVHGSIVWKQWAPVSPHADEFAALLNLVAQEEPGLRWLQEVRDALSPDARELVDALAKNTVP